MNPFLHAISIMGLSRNSADAAGTLWLALKQAGAGYGGSYSGVHPVREVQRLWTVDGSLDSFIGKSIAPLLEGAATQFDR